jgi:hypothetical protein
MFNFYHVYWPGFSNTDPPRQADAMLNATVVVGMHPHQDVEVLQVEPGLQ